MLRSTLRSTRTFTRHLAPTLAGLLVVAMGPAMGFDGASSPPASGLLRLSEEGPDPFLEASRNAAFLDSPVGREQLDALRKVVGRKVADGRMDVSRYQGRTVRELLEENRELLTKHPQALVGLAASTQTGGATVFSDDQSREPLPVSEPGRVIPAQDLQKALTGSSGDPGSFRRYLADNFELDDRQIGAFSTYLALAGEESEASLADRDREGLSSALDGIGRLPSGGDDQDLGEDGQNRGLYLPPGQTLDYIADLQGFLDDFAGAEDPDPGRFRDRAGRTIGDVLDTYRLEGEAPLSMWETSALSPSEVKRRVLERIRAIVDREKEGPNKYLFESGLAFLLPRDQQGGLRRMMNRMKLRRIPSYAPIGNGYARIYTNKLYQALVLDNPGPNTRDYLELESGGDFLAIRGRPSDVFTEEDTPRKHYDPVIDVEGMVFGTGMNLR